MKNKLRKNKETKGNSTHNDPKLINEELELQ